MEKRLNSLLCSTNAFGLVFNHGAWGVSLIDSRSVFVDAGYQEGYSVGSWHGLFLRGRVTFSKVKGNIGDSLSQSFDSNRLEVGISVVEGLNSSVFDESSGISDNTTGSTADVGVDLENLFDWLGDDKSGLESAFDCQDYSFCGLDADGWGAQLHEMMYTLMASMAYSTWKIRPSGEKVLMPRS